MDEIRLIHHESRSIYGAPKITKKLNALGYIIAEKTVGKYMREMNLRAHYIRPYTVTTTDSDFSESLTNILQRDFTPDKPNSYWCTDITYIHTQEEGFVYLISIMDLFSRRIVAWELSLDLKADAVVRCLHQAIDQRHGCRAQVVHSDRGCQYVSEAYLEALGMDMKACYSAKATQ